MDQRAREGFFVINKEHKKTLIQFIKFGIVGVSNTAIGLGTYYLFLYLGCHYMVANVLSWLISVFNAFYWNNKYVFKTATSWTKALIKTYISYGFSFGVGCVVLAILVEILRVSPKVAPLLVLLITIPLNFVLNKFWTFK
jgi:putative flippase GtrA